MNRAELVGGLTKDAELRFTASGMAVLEMTLAVNGARWDGRERAQVVTTSFIACVAFGWAAESIAEMDPQKGDEWYVLGELDQSSFEKADGTKESKTKVVIKMANPTRRHGPPRQAAQVTPIGGDKVEDPF